MTLPLGVFYFKKEIKDRKILQMKELTRQFKEYILAASGLIKAGYSVENAFCGCKKDMIELFGNEGHICLEIEYIKRGLVINMTLQELLEDFALRSGIDEIGQFAGIFKIAGKSGGNMADIINDTANVISAGIDIMTEVDTVLSGRRLENKVMMFMPFFIIGYLDFSYRGYLSQLYGNLKGVGIMTICLIVYVAAYLATEKIFKAMES